VKRLDSGPAEKSAYHAFPRVGSAEDKVIVQRQNEAQSPVRLPSLRRQSPPLSASPSVHPPGSQPAKKTRARAFAELIFGYACGRAGLDGGLPALLKSPPYSAKLARRFFSFAQPLKIND
jgi:hypothetical protein